MKEFLQKNVEAGLFIATAFGVAIGMFVCYLIHSDKEDGEEIVSEYSFEQAHIQSTYYRANSGLARDTPEFDKSESFIEVDGDILKQLQDNYDFLMRNSAQYEQMKSARLYLVQDSPDESSETHYVMVGLRDDRSEITRINVQTGSGPGQYSGYRRISKAMPCPRACDRDVAKYCVITGRE